MSVGVEALFTSALGLHLPWVVEGIKLDTAQRRIDFEIGCQGTALSCPVCGAGLRGQSVNTARTLTPSAFPLALPAAVVCVTAHGHQTAADRLACVGICGQRCRFCGSAMLDRPAPPAPGCANTARVPQLPCKAPRPDPASPQAGSRDYFKNLANEP